MSNYAKKTPEGTKDYLFEECAVKTKIEKSLTELFKAGGYGRVITPALEYYDVYDRECAGIEQKNLYVTQDTSGALIAMRADNTMPIARVVATRLQNVEPPIRLYYNQQIFKRCKSFSGRSNEISQCGIELIGAGGIRADLEILTMAFSALEICNAPDYRIELGTAAYFKSLMNKINADEETKEKIILYVQTKNCIALDEILDTMPDTDAVRAVRRLPRLFGGAEVLDEALGLYSDTEAKSAIDYLKNILQCLKELKLDKKISVDLGLVHRNNYYTGLLFRGYIEGSGLTVLSGGRYDNMIGEFGRNLKATGFGVDINALSKATIKRGDIEKITVPEVLVFSQDGAEAKGMAYAQSLRSSGIVCEYSVASTLEEAKQYAESKGIKKVEVID